MYRRKTFASLTAGVLLLLVSACAVVGEANPAPSVPDLGASVTKVDRTDCGAIAGSDLRSPLEGIWYQTNCLAASQFPQGVATTTCNRPSVSAAEFRQVAPGLYVFRQTASSTAYLWYATTATCFDLVSTRMVTAVCVDGAISFQFDQRTTCSDHRGVLVRINGN